MQKLINFLAIFSFIGTSSILGGGVYVYLNKDALIENAKEKIASAATEAIAEELPGLLDGLLPDIPELPTTTGPAIPFGESDPAVRLP